MGGGREQGHLLVSREDPLSPGCTVAPRDPAELSALRRARSEGRVVHLLEERRTAEPERALHPARAGRHAGGADRPKQLLRRRHVAAREPVTLEGRQVRGVRDLDGRLRLERVSRDGGGDAEGAPRRREVGALLERRVARRRLLLRRVRCPGLREGARHEEPGTEAVLPRGGHDAGQGPARLRGQGAPRPLLLDHDDRGRALLDPVVERQRGRAEGQLALLP